MVIKAKYLRPGDIISLRFSDGGYDTATVRKKDANGDAHVWRPYIHADDVLMSGETVITYIGLEEFCMMANTEVVLLRKGPTLR